MNIYVTKIRPIFTNADADALFVTSEGVAFPEGTIGKRLTSFIDKCGVNLAGRVAFVDMRKVISTEMLSRCTPEEREILRRVLAHSEKTSREWYSRPNLTETGIKAVHIVQRLLDPEARARHQDAATASAGAPPAVKPASSTSSSVMKPPTETSALTCMQKEELKEMFEDNIANGRPVKLHEVRDRIRGVTILSVLAADKTKTKQVANFVNFLARKSAEGESLPSTEVGARSKVLSWLDKLDDPSTRSATSTLRTEWDKKEAKHLEKVFSKFSTLPPTYVIRQVLDGDAKLKGILQRDGWPRIYNKLKNMYRGKK